MEFGWSDSELTSVAADENFASFLEKLLAAYPDGPCRHAMRPYVDHCTFIGRLESIASDLAEALTQAGEVFDPLVLTAPPINESSIAALREACVAPAELLEKFLEAETDFCKRFEYHGVPRAMVGQCGGGAWPKLPSRAAVQLSHDPAADLQLTRTRFTYHLDDGLVVGGGHEQRLQWAIVEAIDRCENPGRCAVVVETDPYAAYLLAAKPQADVTFVPADERVIPRRLMNRLGDSIAIRDFRAFHASGDDEAFDTIVLVDSGDISAALEGELIMTRSKLKPGGALLLVAPVLKTDIPISTTFADGLTPRRGCKLIYRSLSDWRTVLENCGYTAIEVLDSFGEAPDEPLRDQVEELAARLKLDPAHLLGKALIKVERPSAGAEARAPSEARELWIRRQILYLEGAYDSLPSAIEARLLMLEAQAQSERMRRERAEQGMADREQELLAARRQIHSLATEADYGRELIRQAREVQRATEAELEALRTLIHRAKLDIETRHSPLEEPRAINLAAASAA